MSVQLIKRALDDGETDARRCRSAPPMKAGAAIMVNSPLGCGATMWRVTDDDILAAVKDRAGSAPVSEFAVEEAEWVIGFVLPPLLRRTYLEVADGGIGPGAGIVPLAELVRQHRVHLLARRDPDEPPGLPRGVLFLCDFGCAMWAMVDCRHPRGQMWWWDQGDRYKLDLTLSDWLTGWLAGESWDALRRPALRLPEEGRSRHPQRL